LEKEVKLLRAENERLNRENQTLQRNSHFKEPDDNDKDKELVIRKRQR